VLARALELLVTAPSLDSHYIPDAIPTADADFAYLTSDIAWLDGMRARQTASFGLPYNYSGQSYPTQPMPAVIAAIAERARVMAGHSFNNCLCNRYETGAHTMGFHSDSYEGLVESSRIAIASFGTARTLVFRTKDQLHRAEITLEHGSILLMTRATQLAWRHAIPRASTDGCRVSVTLRRIATRP
jgi:alkylated DNA repair dioxygenase AlkB